MNDSLTLYWCRVVIYVAGVLMVRALQTVSQMWIVLLCLIQQRIHDRIICLLWWNLVIRLLLMSLIDVQICLVLIIYLFVCWSIVGRLDELRIASKLVSTIWSTMLSTLCLIAHRWFARLLWCSPRIWSRIISTLTHDKSILTNSLHINLMMCSTNNLCTALSFHLNLRQLLL